MKSIESKRQWEKKVIGNMIAIYCAGNHADREHDAEGLCPECAEFAAYARTRSDRCPMIETKAFCANCPVHCYKPSMREKIRQVMRYAGPRMIWHHPVDACRHLVWNTREKRQLAKKAAQEAAKQGRQ